MPSITSITVKKNDGTTDIIYTGVQPSSGDSTNAVWKSASVGTAPNHQPEIRLMAKEAKAGASRELRLTGSYPQIATNTTTGVTSVVDKAFMGVTWTVPKGMNQADINEFAAQFTNVLASAMLKDCIKQGYSAS